MPISRDLIRQVRALDVYDLRRLQMVIRGLLVADDADPAEAGTARPDGRSEGGKVTFRQEMVRCGKQGCTRCPHGPYWYAYWREDGKMHSRYVGKTLPSRNAETDQDQKGD